MLIRRMAAVPPPFDGAFHPSALPEEWARLDEFEIARYPWDTSGYRPRAFARVGVSEKGLHALLYAFEETIQHKETGVGGMVCVDSCMEFFFQPVAGDARYLNIEVNPVGAVCMEIGAGREGRARFSALPSGMNLRASAHAGGWWAVSYTVPAQFIRELFGAELSGRIRANFYKCDESIHPHFGTHFPVCSARPDFHRPEDFGTIEIEEG